MSSLSVSWFERTLSNQLIALLLIGTITIMIMFVVSVMKNVPSLLIGALMISSLFVLIISSINVSCMVLGGCQVWSWITTVLSLITILLMYTNALRR